MWPVWGAATRTALLNGAAQGRALCEEIRPQALTTQTLIREMRERLPQSGPERARQEIARAQLAAILDRIPDYRPGLWDLRILVGHLELSLRNLEHEKPAGETWPRNSRPAYEDALTMLEGAGARLTVVDKELTRLVADLERLERPGRATASAWLSTLPAALLTPQQAAQRVVDALGATHHHLIELSNVLLRVRVDGEDDETL